MSAAQRRQFSDYWTKLPLQLKPSKLELAELARSAESVDERARYAGILEAIESRTYSLRPGCRIQTT
jgi:hypothetical protein